MRLWQSVVRRCSGGVHSTPALRRTQQLVGDVLQGVGVGLAEARCFLDIAPPHAAVAVLEASFLMVIK